MLCIHVKWKLTNLESCSFAAFSKTEHTHKWLENLNSPINYHMLAELLYMRISLLVNVLWYTFGEKPEGLHMYYKSTGKLKFLTGNMP